MRLRDDLIRCTGRCSAEEDPVPYHGHSRSSHRPSRVRFSGGEEDLGHSAVVSLGMPNSWRGVPHSQFSTTGQEYRFAATGVRTVPPPRSATMIGPQVRLGFVNGGYSFTPDSSRFFDPLASTPDDWAPTSGEGQERMVTRETWYPIEHHQSVVLRRPDGLLALAVARLPVVSFAADRVRAAVAMGRPADLLTVVAGAEVDEAGTVRGSVDLEDGQWMVSVEARAPDWVARVRHGVAVPLVDERGFGVSAPVLLHHGSEGDGRSVVNAMLPTTDLGAEARADVYVEVYGVEPGEVVRMSITVEPRSIERSILGRVARALGLGTQPTPLEVSWTEVGEGARPDRMEHQVGLDLRRLDAGEYGLVVRVERPDGSVASATRTLRLSQ